MSRYVLWPSRVVLGSLAIAFALGLEVPKWLEYGPFLASLVFLGLPHGAVDHLVPDRLLGRVTTSRSVAAVILLYIALGTFYLVFWILAPVAAFAFFIVLTWFHWGQGDLHALTILEDRPKKLLDNVGTVFVRGGLPMLVPLIAHPEVYREVFLNASGIFGNNLSGTANWAFEPTFRVVAALALALVAAFLFFRRILEASTEERGSVVGEALEAGLLVAYFVVVPPVLAVGLYFCIWHATRHIARLTLLDKLSRKSLERGEFWPALAVFMRDAAPLTAVALVMLAGLYSVVPGVRAEAGALLGVYM
ncbi:MAG: Brp/Blh family beta-carotene 15,15'-dioxygenase, partial [Rubrobacteraceae bacterium]